MEGTQPETYRTLADYITVRGRQMGLNTTSLSEALGFGRSYINSVVNGQFQPSKKRCWRIAEFFGDDPNIILGLAGYYEPPQQDSLITSLTQAINSLPRRLQRDLLRYAHYLKARSLPSAVREKTAPYGNDIIYLELPSGEIIEIEVDHRIATLPAEEIRHAVATDLKTLLK